MYHPADQRVGQRVALGRRLAKQAERLLRVALPGDAVVRVAQGGGLAVPFHCRRPVLLTAAALFVELAERVHRDGVALPRRLLVPLDRLLRIPDDAAAILVHLPQADHRIGPAALDALLE